MRTRKAAALAAAAILAAGMVTGAQGQASAAHAAVHCVKPTKLAKPESLNKWYKDTGIAPAITLMVVEQCDGLHNGWTPQIAKLLDGFYGQNIFTARLPKGTLLWKQL